MKELLKNLWTGPGSTVAGAITAGLTFIMAADVKLETFHLSYHQGTSNI